MRVLCALFAIVFLTPAASACTRAVCAIAPEELSLSRRVDFEDMPAGLGPGYLYRTPIIASGAQFGEGFVGQARASEGPYDRLAGPAIPPLRLAPVPRGELLSINKLGATRVLNGLGPAGYPRRAAEGEGAIAILFDNDQAALSLHIRGGEDGTAWVTFLTRDGALLDQHTLPGLAEDWRAFHTPGMVPRIAALILTNDDPEGIALDELRFGLVTQMGAVGLGAGDRAVYVSAHVVSIPLPPARP